MTSAYSSHLEDPITEQLLKSLVALAAEVNVLRDRLARLEAQHNGTEIPDSLASAEMFVGSIFGGMTDMGTHKR